MNSGGSAREQLETEAHQQNVEFGHESRSVAWDIENCLLQQINEELKAEIEELKRKRVEDMKANQRLLSIFSSKEAAWKVEKRKLKQELQDAIRKANGIIYTNNDHIDEHNDPATVAHLKEQNHKLEGMLKNAMVETTAWKRNAALKAKEKMNVDAVLRRVTEELLNLQKEVNDRDDIISALSEKKLQKDLRLRDTAEAELKAMELQLSNAQSLLKQYTDAEQTRETEGVKWKKLYLAIKTDFEILQRRYTNSYPLNANAS